VKVLAKLSDFYLVKDSKGTVGWIAKEVAL